MIKALLAERGTDNHGSGYFGAPRGSRKHKGVDYACPPGTLILSPVSGEVTKVSGYPYDPSKNPDKAHLRYVEVTSPDGYRHRFFYCRPASVIEIGDLVIKDDAICYSQGLLDIWPDMTDHIHYEIMRPDSRECIDPAEYYGNQA